MRRLGSIFLFASAVLLPSTALAGGIEVPDLGPTALGRGSAFTAKADNLEAFHYNPAGLTKSKGINVLIGANLINANIEFQRAGSDDFACYTTTAPAGCAGDPGGLGVWDPNTDPNSPDFAILPDGTARGNPYAPVSNQKKIGPSPIIVLNWGDVGKVEGLSIAAGLLPPSAMGFPTYDEKGAQRYNLHHAEALLVMPGVSVGYRINRYISIGATFFNGITHASFAQSARGTINPRDPTRNETHSGDATFAIEVRDWFSPGGQIGLLSNPIDELELGVSVRTPVKVAAQGFLDMSPSEDNSDASLHNGAVEFRQELPWVVRTGIRYIHRRFDIEVDYVWEGWGKTIAGGEGNGFEIDFADDTYVDVPNLGGEFQLFDVVLLKEWRDTHSVRLGSDIEVVPENFALRVGGWWTSSSLPKDHRTMGVDFPIAMQFAATGGLTWHAIPRKVPNPHKQSNWLDVTVGYSHIFQGDKTVTNGVIQQQGIRGSEDEPRTGNVVNNGTYKVNYNIFGVSLEGHF
jgi:long-chain fatty acid transport protein